MNDLIYRASTVEESRILRQSYLEIAEAYNTGRPVHDGFYCVDEGDDDPNVAIRFMRPLIDAEAAEGAFIAMISASDLIMFNRLFYSFEKETQVTAPILLPELKQISLQNLKNCK